LPAIETLWWLLFWTAFGLCVGSFLNVAIYRIPQGLSIRQPVWSFCDGCGVPIRWYDNIPLWSYLRLGGRCRRCQAEISLRYPLIEVATAVVVLLLLDAFFVGRVRAGLYGGAIGLTWRLSQDWPIFLAHVILFACLLSMAAIDLEHYWIDARLALVAAVAGFVLHGLWTPYYSLAGTGRGSGWIRPWDSTAVVCLAAFVGLAVVGLVLRWTASASNGRPELPEPGAVPPGASGPSAVTDDGRRSNDPTAEIRRVSEADQGKTSRPEGSAPGLKWAWALGAFLLAFLAVVGGADQWAEWPVPAWVRYAVPLVGLFVLVVAGGSARRPADQAIMQSIESERPWARKTALWELLCLTPAILLAAATWVIYRRWDGAAEWMASVLHWRAWGQWQPVFGLATAASGYVIAAGVGWSVRIVATLVWGREAFGDGDIYLMAAAGCIAGWPVVALGFVVACFLALAGWVLTLPFKRTRAVPLVPWLALSFLIAVVFYERLLQFQPVRNVITVTHWLLFGNSQPLGDEGLP
jgi:prepilin signal peptidase PulO-like enzyme (type II secretory pathway)